jgi:predicted RNase H-like HicB family nuclease
MNHVKTYTITIIPTSGAYRAVCLGLPACEASAPTREEALERIEDQIKARIAEATVHGRPVPVDRTSTKFLWINVEEFLV